MYSNKILCDIIKTDLDKRLFDNVDKNGCTCLMLSAQYNAANLTLLIKNTDYMKGNYMYLHDLYLLQIFPN